MIKEVLSLLLHSEVFWTVVALAVVALISLIVKRTKTQKDDAIWAMIVHAFNIADKVVTSGSNSPAWLQKSDKALQVLNESYFERYGSAVPSDIKTFAKDQWALLAAEIKKK